MSELRTTPPAPDLPAEAVQCLRSLYDELDGKLDLLLARHPGSGCRECGRCCTFPPGSPVLYATALEQAYLAVEPPPLDARLPEGACPYFELDTSFCTGRERRTIACRTHFCDEASPSKAAREEAQDLYEWALSVLRGISDAHGLEWGYATVIDRL